MKAILAFLLLPLALAATPILFHWHPPVEPVAGYRLYQGPSRLAYTNVIVIPADMTNFLMDVKLGFGETNYFAFAAFDTNGLESLPTPDKPWTPDAPDQPLVKLISERTLDGVLWHAALTNWVVAEWPVDFWRVRIERP